MAFPAASSSWSLLSCEASVVRLTVCRRVAVGYVGAEGPIAFLTIFLRVTPCCTQETRARLVCLVTDDFLQLT